MLQSQKMHSFLSKTIIGLIAVLVAGMGIALTVSPVESAATYLIEAPAIVPPAWENPPQPAPEAPPPPTKFAVIIGIVYNSYELGTVNFADQDAASVYNLLTRQMGFPPQNVMLLQNAQATGANIVQALRWLTENPGVDANSEVVFYYSGHGLRNEGMLNIPQRGRSYALVPFDYFNFPYKNGEGLIWDVDLAALLSKIQPARMWVSIDSCFSGGFARPGITGPNRIVTMSSSATEISNEINEAQRGVFTKYMVDDGLARGLSVEDAFLAAAPPSSHYSQNPQVNDGYPGGMSLK